MYHQALQVERAQALECFSGVVGKRLGLPPGQLPDWAVTFRTALGLTGGDAPLGPDSSGPARLLVLAELPYLLDHSPEIPSVLQEMWDENQDRPGPPAAVIVCGSALSVMADLLCPQPSRALWRVPGATPRSVVDARRSEEQNEPGDGDAARR